jgi:hypothetical protein
MRVVAFKCPAGMAVRCENNKYAGEAQRVLRNLCGVMRQAALGAGCGFVVERFFRVGSCPATREDFRRHKFRPTPPSCRKHLVLQLY